VGGGGRVRDRQQVRISSGGSRHAGAPTSRTAKR
jgi:hypothetical protein